MLIYSICSVLLHCILVPSSLIPCDLLSQFVWLVIMFTSRCSLCLFHVLNPKFFFILSLYSSLLYCICWLYLWSSELLILNTIILILRLHDVYTSNLWQNNGPTKRVTRMDLPAVQLLCLEQEEQSLETHTNGFLDLPCITSFLDWSLSVFSQACLPDVGPQGISGCWWIAIHHWQSASLRRRSPACCHPAARTMKQSLPTEELSLPRGTNYLLGLRPEQNF